MRRLLIIWIVIVFNLLIPSEGISCPIPVFRYALEFWDADPYIVEVYYQNSLVPSEQALVDILLMASRGGDTKANLELRSLDIEGNIDEITRGYINRLTPEKFPLIVLRYPRVSGINEVIWSGPLSRENVDNMLRSPARERIAEKLAGDVTTVWVFLESGDRRKDRAALDLLNNQLRRLEQTLALPDLELWWSRSHNDADEVIPVVNFDVVSVSRDDPREAYLVRMLMNTEDDLKEFESEPIVFPIYGRGIALWAIVGKGINEWNITEAAEFLTGPCSCQAKLLNPGVDLLIAMDWDGVVENIADMSIANPLSGIGDFGSREEEVRNRLESATDERLGTAVKKDEHRATDSKRIVYLDIFGDNLQEAPDIGYPPASGTKAGEEARAKARAVADAGAEAIAEARAAAAAGTDADPRADDSPETIAADHEYSHADPRADTHSEVRTDAVDQSPKKTDLMSFIVMVFAGAIALVVLGAVFLYWKRIR